MAYFPVLKVPVIPDEVDAVDAGDVVEGFGVHGWRRGCRVRRVGWWFQVEASVRIPNLIEIPNFLISWVNYEFARHRSAG